MKKAIMLTVSFFLLTITATFGASDRQEFLNDINDEIYEGILSGDLTKREVKAIRKSIRNYQYKVWELADFGRISRNEERALQRLERDLLADLETLLYNRETARRSTYPRTNREYYGQGNRPTSYGNRSPRRSNGTYCPPPRRRW